MRLADQIRGVRHTFDANRGRTLLTLIGIMIGAGSIVLLASLLRGGEEALLRSEQGAADSDVVQVDADEAPAKDQKKTRRDLGRRDTETLDGSPLLPGAEIASERSRWTRAIYHKKKKRVSLVGAAPVALSLYRLEVEKGRFITDDDLRDGQRICVIGIGVWEQLLEKEPLESGVQLTVDGQQWLVVGVLKNKPPLGGGGDGPWMWNNKVVVPQTTFDAVFDNTHLVDEIFVRIGGDGPLAARLTAARKSIESTLLRRHYGVANFKIDRWGEEAKQEQMILQVIKILLLTTGLLSLFVGGINIMNIMLVTVTERTREIGVRRAIGASPSSILTQFLLESAVIALAGGLIGIVGGIAFSMLIAWALTAMLGQWNLHIEAWSIALGLGLSISTGVIFGLFPAWRAARLDPVEALRYE